MPNAVHHREWDARKRVYVQVGAVSVPDELQTIVERRDWLHARIAAKQSIGWETGYDEREHKALCWALGKLIPSEDDGA